MMNKVGMGNLRTGEIFFGNQAQERGRDHGIHSSEPPLY